MSSKSKKKCLKRIDHFSAHLIKFLQWMKKMSLAGMSTLKPLLLKVETTLDSKHIIPTLQIQEEAVIRWILLMQLP